jgi:hypothetical protein
MGNTGSEMKGLDEASEMLAKMAEKAAKLQAAADGAEDLDDFRRKAGLRRGLRRTPLLSKEDAERASSSEEERAMIEEQEALGDDIAKFMED